VVKESNVTSPIQRIRYGVAATLAGFECIAAALYGFMMLGATSFGAPLHSEWLNWTLAIVNFLPTIATFALIIKSVNAFPNRALAERLIWGVVLGAPVFCVMGWLISMGFLKAFGR
jgi:hypothetical protein